MLADEWAGQNHTTSVGAQYMFTITNRLRMLVAVGAVGAALASSGVPSAASAFHNPGTATPVVASQTTTVVAKYIDPDNVGSAGILGYDDQRCEDLANQHNDLENAGYDAVRAGNAAGFKASMDAADQVEDQLDGNCMVID
jgi:hypothetical protein